MTAKMDRVPLLEAVAELRWGMAGAMPEQFVSGQSFTIGHDSSSSEDFFMNFGAECAGLGMSRAERVVPPGFPLLPGQVVYRFRSTDKGLHNILQVGPGVFSANALPPYRSWVEFKEFISRGIDALLASRSASEKDSEFIYANLRYINGFGPEYRDGHSSQEFLRKLGFTVSKPTALSRLLADAKEEVNNISIVSKIDGKSSFQVNVSEGIKDNVPAQIVELSAFFSNLSPDRDVLLAVFDEAHRIIESIYFNMIEELD